MMHCKLRSKLGGFLKIYPISANVCSYKMFIPNVGRPAKTVPVSWSVSFILVCVCAC